MLFRVLADIVVVVHFIWIVFLIFGALFGRRYKTVKYIHIGGLSFALVIQAVDWYCPLTHLEIWLRTRQCTPEPYAGSFIIHYLEKIIYVEAKRWVIVILTLMLCLFNVWIYKKQSNG